MRKHIFPSPQPDPNMLSPLEGGPVPPDPMGITRMSHVRAHLADGEAELGPQWGFGPCLCFQRHLDVLPTQTHPCLVHKSPSNASLPLQPPFWARAPRTFDPRLLCTEDAWAQVYLMPSFVS